MRSSANNTPHRFTWRLLVRCFWAVMLLVHAPALIAAGRNFVENGVDSSRLIGWIGLLGATLFFVLKLRGVEFLKFSKGRHAAAVLTLAVVLMHAEVIGSRFDWQTGPKALPLAGTTLFVTGFSRVRQWAGSILLQGREASKRTLCNETVVDSAYVTNLAPYHRLACGCLSIPRAPPA